MLSTGEFAALRSVGFEPVGLVMGSAVYHVAYYGPYGDCFDCRYADAGRYGRGYYPSAVALSGTGAPSAALVQVLDTARRTAIGRMATECAALGGDGVVAAQLTMVPFPSAPNCLEFKVIGTAVRAAGPIRPRWPFTSHLDGLGFAKLVTAGWVPVQLLVGMSVGVRHDDYQTLQQKRSRVNREMHGWSELIRRVRADARTQLSLQVAGYGADGVILADAALRHWEQPCPRVRGEEEQVDHITDCLMIGTAIARFAATPSAAGTLSVLSLKRDDSDGEAERLRHRLAQAVAGRQAH
ncbi:heavy metal-binding domain-containing protein [Streptacidiphilus monticola]|uniref:Heavy metal-binding domain-containing protein n=1 Tax=Streptacidiphilus monticola TaxID=2161674 RepID=A0ABW1FX69_9ACTN